MSGLSSGVERGSLVWFQAVQDSWRCAKLSTNPRSDPRFVEVPGFFSLKQKTLCCAASRAAQPPAAAEALCSSPRHSWPLLRSRSRGIIEKARLSVPRAALVRRQVQERACGERAAPQLRAAGRAAAGRPFAAAHRRRRRMRWSHSGCCPLSPPAAPPHGRAPRPCSPCAASQS